MGLWRALFLAKYFRMAQKGDEQQSIDEDDFGGIFLFSGSKTKVIEVPEEVHCEKIERGKLRPTSAQIETIIVEFKSNTTHNLPLLPPLDKKAYKTLTDDFRLGDNTNAKKNEDVPTTSTTPTPESPLAPHTTKRKAKGTPQKKQNKKPKTANSGLMAHLQSLGIRH